MQAPFAALEERANAAVFARLSNAEAIFDDCTVLGVFDYHYDLLTPNASGVAAGQPVFVLPTADAPKPPLGLTGSVLSINGRMYRVVANEPDGTGLTRLHLEIYLA